MERTYLMVKPDGVQRGLAGEIIARFEKRGFKIAALKMLRISRELAEKHYGEHVGKPFFEPLVDFHDIAPSPVAPRRTSWLDRPFTPAPQKKTEAPYGAFNHVMNK